MRSPLSGPGELGEAKHFKDVHRAAEHVIAWFEVEETEYASREKFGYERNLGYLQAGGIEPGSVWDDSELSSYWSRATFLDQALRAEGEDPVAARQLFAIHANASRALLSTIYARCSRDSYVWGKIVARNLLDDEAHRLNATKLLFKDSAEFDSREYWNDVLLPLKNDIRMAARGNLDPSIPWSEVMAQTDEKERLGSAAKPTEQFLLHSFGVVVAYVYHDGPLPKPGVPSGEVIPWAPTI